MDRWLCDELVYRGVTRASQIDSETGVLAVEAFVRRPRPKDIDGLSVSCKCSPEDCARSFRKCYAVASLHVGKVRDIKGTIDVVQDADDHANITGVPYGEDEPAEAEWIAGWLSERARVVLGREECRILGKEAKARKRDSQ